MLVGVRTVSVKPLVIGVWALEVMVLLARVVAPPARPRPARIMVLTIFSELAVDVSGLELRVARGRETAVVEGGSLGVVCRCSVEQIWK